MKAVTTSNLSLVMDPCKVRRSKMKMMNLLKEQRKQDVSKELTAVYFDSKQCSCLVEKVINGKIATVTGKEDLYVLVEVNILQ